MDCLWLISSPPRTSTEPFRAQNSPDPITNAYGLTAGLKFQPRFSVREPTGVVGERSPFAIDLLSRCVGSDLLHRRVVPPILNLLRQGITPEKIALGVALALVLGAFPALGWTTSLCLIAARRLRLNVAAMQLVNSLAYPLQLMLLVPSIRGGELLFRAPGLSLSLHQILSMVLAGLWQAIKTLWVATIPRLWCMGRVAPERSSPPSRSTRKGTLQKGFRSQADITTRLVVSGAACSRKQ
jgi:hypothetical protein